MIHTDWPTYCKNAMQTPPLEILKIRVIWQEIEESTGTKNLFGKLPTPYSMNLFFTEWSILDF